MRVVRTFDWRLFDAKSDERSGRLLNTYVKYDLVIVIPSMHRHIYQESPFGMYIISFGFYAERLQHFPVNLYTKFRVQMFQALNFVSHIIDEPTYSSSICQSELAPLMQLFLHS